MVNPRAPKNQCTFLLLILVSYLESFSHQIVELLFSDLRALTFLLFFLRVSRLIILNLRNYFFFQSRHVFRYLVKLLHAEAHNSVKAPENIGVDMLFVEQNVNYLLVA